MDKISTREILSNIEFFSRQSRYPGSNGSTDARNKICEILRVLGYSLKFHKSSVESWGLSEDPTVEITSSDTTESKIIPAIPFMLSSPTPINGVVGKLAQAESLNVLDSFEWMRLSIVDERSNPLAYIASSDKDVKVQPLPESAGKVPHIAISYSNYLHLLSILDSDKISSIRVKNPSWFGEKIDLISIVTEPLSSPYILVCAHYDTTYNSNGALDNASGVAIALSLANIIKKNNLPCCLAFFDGEELNKIGSKTFVDSLNEQALASISYVLEIDTVGAGNDLIFLCSKKLSKPLRNIPFNNFIPSEFTIQINPQSRISFSDVWPFMKNGIPVIRMLTRAPKGSGQGHDLIHSPNDIFNNVNPETIMASYSAALNIINFLCDKKLS